MWARFEASALFDFLRRVDAELSVLVELFELPQPATASASTAVKANRRKVLVRMIDELPLSNENG